MATSATAATAETAAPDDRRYCHDPDYPKWLNFPYGQPDEHVTETCACDLCEERGQTRMSVAQRRILGNYEQIRRREFKLMRCSAADCNATAFVHRRAGGKSRSVALRDAPLYGHPSIAACRRQPTLPLPSENGVRCCRAGRNEFPIALRMHRHRL